MNVEISQEFVNPFSDRYEPIAKDSVVVPPAPKVKSVVVRGLFPSKPMEESSSAAVMLPGPRLVLYRDLPKVLLIHIPKSILSNSFRNMSLLDIDINTYIPEYFV